MAPGTGLGARGGFGIAFSFRAIRDLRLLFMAHCGRVAAACYLKLADNLVVHVDEPDIDHQRVAG